jgi:hypothetical protein
VENGQEYFIAVNSWSREWGGLNGTFKLDIKMLKESRGDLYAAVPNLDY